VVVAGNLCRWQQATDLEYMTATEGARPSVGARHNQRQLDRCRQTKRQKTPIRGVAAASSPETPYNICMHLYTVAVALEGDRWDHLATWGLIIQIVGGSRHQNQSYERSKKAILAEWYCPLESYIR